MLFMTFSLVSGTLFRRFVFANVTGLRRTVCNVRLYPRGGRAGRGGGAGRPGEAGAAGRSGGADEAVPPTGRGSQQGALVAPGRYRAQLGKQVGNDVTPLGAPQSFSVIALEQRR
jgi:hypothetical protein